MKFANGDIITSTTSVYKYTKRDIPLKVIDPCLGFSDVRVEILEGPFKGSIHYLNKVDCKMVAKKYIK